MIELAILGLLKERSLHGYELKKRLHDVLGARSAVSFGSLYPALNRLERDGAVAAVGAGLAGSAPTTPMTGSFAGEAAAFRASRQLATRGPRNKKVYGITPAGESRLAALLADPGEDERSFPVKVAFCRFADPATRLGLLERRRATLVERLGEGRRTIGTRGDRLDRYVRSLLEHDTESTERDIAWLDRLLDDERALLPASDADEAPGQSDGEGTGTDTDTDTDTDTGARVHEGLEPARAPAPALPVAAPVPAAPIFPKHQPSRSDGIDTADTANGGSR